jgi:hypothetical protein
VRGRDDIIFRGHTRMIICWLDTGMLPGTIRRSQQGRVATRCLVTCLALLTLVLLAQSGYIYLRTHHSSRNAYDTFPFDLCVMIRNEYRGIDCCTLGYADNCACWGSCQGLSSHSCQDPFSPRSLPFPVYFFMTSSDLPGCGGSNNPAPGDTGAIKQLDRSYPKL